MCPHPQNLDYLLLFSWSAYTTACLITVCLVRAPLRLAAFSTLGRNFTFQLHTPSSLTTTGMYRYIQHPSYTGQVLLVGGNLAAFWRWDEALGCWVVPGVRAALSGWGRIVFSLFLVLAVSGLRRRVADEERMLKEKFGDEWVRWHGATKQFVPGLF
jgi:protein-S-isoprenylcysteine O-methyltransferase Ste14